MQVRICRSLFPFPWSSLIPGQMLIRLGDESTQMIRQQNVSTYYMVVAVQAENEKSYTLKLCPFPCCTYTVHCPSWPLLLRKNFTLFIRLEKKWKLKNRTKRMKDEEERKARLCYAMLGCFSFPLHFGQLAVTAKNNPGFSSVCLSSLLKPSSQLQQRKPPKLSCLTFLNLTGRLQCSAEEIVQCPIA